MGHWSRAKSHSQPFSIPYEGCQGQSPRISEYSNNFLSTLTHHVFLQPTIHRVPIHEVASVSFVKDDNDNLVFVKAGQFNMRTCPVYVFNCTKQVRTAAKVEEKYRKIKPLHC